MTKEEYENKKLQICTLNELMKEFKYGTGLDTARNQLVAQCDEYKKHIDKYK